MREKLKSLPLTELKAIAKHQGIKGVSTMRKNDLIELLCARAKELEEESAPGGGQASSEEARRTGNSVYEKRTKKERERVKPDRQQTSGQASEDLPDQTGEDQAGAVQPSGEPPEQLLSEHRANADQQPADHPLTGRSGDQEQPGAGGSWQPYEEQPWQQSAYQPAQPYEGQLWQQPVGRAGTPGQAAGDASQPDSVRDSYRRNDNQNRTQRTAGRQTYNNRTPYGYGPAGGRTDSRGGAPMNRNAGTRPSSFPGAGTDAARQSGAAAGRADAARPFQTQDTSQAENLRVEGPKVSPASITPQIQAQFPDQTIQDIVELDSGIEANGILEVMPDGFGFIRCENFLPGENDVYVAPSQIRRFNLKTGDILVGSRRVKTASEKFAALLYVRSVNGYPPSVIESRPSFEKLTPVFPYERLHMETPGRPNSTAMRVLDLLAPIGKGQRGMIVSPPKAGKTTLLKQVAQAITTNHPDMHLIILLIDERPEEVTDIRESVVGKNVEVIYSTFDELPERHKRVSEMVVERARRLVEHGRDVIILLDSITRLARAYNIVVPPSGRTLSGGMDPAALHMPKRFFGAARKMREGGSLTILATALVNTGSRMDDVVYEEFKGTGNMELVLDRKLSEKRIFPAIDILKSGTRNDQLLLTREEQEAVDIIHKATNGMKAEDAVERILDLFARTRTNREFIDSVRRMRFI